jgi:hypothetical protein
VRRIVDVLMQTAPDGCTHLTKDIVAVEGVLSVHDLVSVCVKIEIDFCFFVVKCCCEKKHVWTLVDGVTVGSAHVVCATDDFLAVSKRVREVL